MEKLIVTEEFYIDPRLQEEIEQQLLELPIVQYAWLPAKELTFSENVRKICREECPRYGTSWACPPAVGTVTECQERCNAYPGAIVFTTIAEVADTANLEETLATRGEHEAVTKEIRKILQTKFEQTLALSADSCEICGTCAYPNAPCRHPDHMVPCIEGYGVVVADFARKAGIEFMNGAGIVTWFGMVLVK